jgi:hypothetical protein
MKKFVSPILIGMTLFALLLSCKEEDNTANNKSRLIGDWDPKSIEWSGCKDSEEDSLRSLACINGFCMKYSFVLDTTNKQLYYITTKVGAIQTTESGFYTVSNDKLSLCQDNEGKIECDEYTMIIRLNNLTLRRTLEDSGCTESITLSRSSS